MNEQKIIGGSPVAFTIFVFIFLLFPLRGHSYSNNLSLDASLGYSNLALKPACNRSTVNGASVRARLSYTFNDFLGIAIAGSLSFQEPYFTMKKVEIEDVETEEIMVVSVKDQNIKLFSVQDVSLGFFYAFDILRVVPYFELAMASYRFLEKNNQIDVVSYDLAIRTDLGADYSLTKLFKIGVLISQNSFLTGKSGHKSQASFLLRFSFCMELNSQ